MNKQNRRFVLGIDTSNYKTSVAITDDRGEILCDYREFLNVKQGERGLRQSDALFQHIKNLPLLFNRIRKSFNGTLSGVAYSSRPRPVEGSYMPVFLAGESFAKSIGDVLRIPVFDFSHQEGHIEAIKAFSKYEDETEFLACHFSGGTSELLDVKDNGMGYNIYIVGGSKDISYGQVVDRLGVKLGLSFPPGEVMDGLALNTEEASKVLTAIKVNDGWLNLSGIDTQVSRQVDIVDSNELIKEVFEKIADSMIKMIRQGVIKTGKNKVIMAGGVSSSRYIRAKLIDGLNKEDITVVFDDNGLSQDNAVGISLLGGRALWD